LPEEAQVVEAREALLARVSAADGTTEIRDPATGEVIGKVTYGTPEDVKAAVDTAAAAQPAWAALRDDERVAFLNRAADNIEEHAEELAYAIVREQGKPINGLGARYEVAGCVGWLRATAATPLPTEVLVDDETNHAELHYRPIGVVGAITPWNWPLIIATWQIAPSLRMGNTVVQKPSEYTTLCALALIEVLNEVLPEGVLTAVTGAGDVGEALVRDKRVGKVMFTGSVKTGMKVVEESAGNLCRLTLELGGNDAGVVLPDVDPDKVAEGLFYGAFINNGQTCAALKRLYVPDAIYDQVIDSLAAFTATMPTGNGLDENTALGPLQNQMQWNVVNRLVEDARQRGARVVMGGDPDTSQPGFFYPKTLIADIDDDAPLVQEEQFGPVLPIIRYTDLEQAIAWANGVDVGLGASVWSADRDKAKEIAARLEAGTVWINGHGGIHPMVPFGGAKHSGYGLEFGVEGLKSVSVPQVISG
jgi:acyl-CoA reductase-like NAD-dependent aldehyde dehydrogenase